MLKATLMMGLLVAGASMAWAQADPALIAKGEKIFADKKCTVCHAVKGKGGTAGPLVRGPELSTVGAKRDVRWLKRLLKDPKATDPKAKMLPFRGTDDELEALVAYLSTLK